MTSMPDSNSKSRGTKDDLVVAQRLTKVFKDFWMRDRARAVDGIEFAIHRGEIFGLLGPNGSGKSTTIKMILGLLRPTSGRLAVFGRPATEVAIKKRIGYLPEESYLYPFLNARETLDYYGRLFELDHRTRKRRTEELLDMVGLTAVQYRQVHEYSKGMQRRIGIAQALINDPEFLILDEPTTGLDPIGTRQVKDLILQLGDRGKTVLLSSHLLADVEDVVSRMVILYGGKIRAQGTCEELLASKTRSTIAVDNLDEETLGELRGVLERRGLEVADIDRPRQKLEDLFVDMVAQAKKEKLATSGATNEGETAAFLRGEDAEGDELVSELVSEEIAPDPMPTEDVQRGVHDQPVESSPLSDLLQEKEPIGEAVEDTRSAEPSEEENEEKVDDSVIHSLLDGSGDEQRRKSE
ncbi:MAG: ABC transporter ATP-binding protein [Planctomycetota bacterium]